FRKLVAAAFFARPFGAAAAAATPAWRALTEVRAVGGFGAPAGGVERFAELAPVPRPVRLVPLGAGVFPEDFDAEDGGVEARRTPAARRAPPVVGFCARRERSDEPRDERRESLMAAPGPSGTRTGPGVAAVAVRTQPLSMTTTGAPPERPGGEASRVCTSRAAPLTSRRGGPHTTSTPRRRAAGLPGRAVRSPRGPPTRRAAPARRAPRRAGRAPSAGRAGAGRPRPRPDRAAAPGSP